MRTAVKAFNLSQIKVAVLHKGVSKLYFRSYTRFDIQSGTVFVHDYQNQVYLFLVSSQDPNSSSKIEQNNASLYGIDKHREQSGKRCLKAMRFPQEIKTLR